MSVTLPELDLPPVDAPIARRRSVLIALIGLVVFGAGCATGGAIAVNYYFKKQVETRNPIDPPSQQQPLTKESERWVNDIVDRLSGDLALTDEQRVPVAKAVTTCFEESDAVRRDSHAKFDEIRKKMETAIIASLDPEQAVKYEDKLKKMRQFTGPPPGWGRDRGKDRRDRKDGERKEGERKEGERWRPPRDWKGPPKPPPFDPAAKFDPSKRGNPPPHDAPPGAADPKSTTDANPAQTKPIDAKPGTP